MSKDVEFVVRTIAQTVLDNEQYFSELDGVVGDGDFGYSIARGFEKVLQEGSPIFTLAEDEMEMGIGIHGEPGRKRVKLTNADKIVEDLMEAVASDLPYKSGDEVALMINGLGGTPISELFLLYSCAHDLAERRGLKIKRNYVGEYCTSLEMAGFSLTLVKLDPELETLLAAPAEAAIKIF